MSRKPEDLTYVTEIDPRLESDKGPLQVLSSKPQTEGKAG